MRTSSLKGRTNSRRSSRRRRHVIYGAILTVLLLALLMFLHTAIGSTSSLVTTPIRYVTGVFAQSVGDLPSYIGDRNALLEERRRLKEELASQSDSADSIEQLRLENEELRLLLHATSSDRIAAGVIARPNQTPYDTLLIDRGSQDGIEERAVVYADSDVAIGFVHKVFPKSALVALASTPGIRATAYIFGPDVYAETEGVGGGTLVVGVPQGIPLEEENLVVLPSLDGGIFGRVSYVESLESSPQQYGFVTSPVSLNSLRFVAVSRVPMPELSFEAAEEMVRTIQSDLLTVDVPDEILVSTTTATTTSQATTTDEL